MCGHPRLNTFLKYLPSSGPTAKYRRTMPPWFLLEKPTWLTPYSFPRDLPQRRVCSWEKKISTIKNGTAISDPISIDVDAHVTLSLYTCPDGSSSHTRALGKGPPSNPRDLFSYKRADGTWPQSLCTNHPPSVHSRLLPSRTLRSFEISRENHQRGDHHESGISWTPTNEISSCHLDLNETLF